MTPRDGLPPQPGRPDRDEPADAPHPDAPHPGRSPRAEPSGGATAVGWLPRATEALFGEGAEAEEAYGLLTADVPADNWIPALTAARDELGCTYFDWLSAVDEPGAGFRVCAHLVALPTASAGVRRLVVRTTVPHDAATLPTATGVYAGAAWHERETHEMFGLDFPGHPGLDPLLLPDSFEGHPLRKDFVLAARVVKAWPGAKEPGESGHGGGGRRRQMRPPGVPDPNEWGPQAGQAPASEERPHRARRATAGGGEPAARSRRSRSASAGSASQRPEGAADPAAESPTAPAAPPESESGAEGPAASAPRAEPPAARPRRSRSASGGSASQRAEGAEAEGPGPEGPGREAGPRSADAPWHHARPAFQEGEEGEEGKERDDGDGDDERGEA